MVEYSKAYRALLHNMPNAFVEIAVQISKNDGCLGCRVMDANPAFFQLHGLSREEVLGKELSELFPEKDYQGNCWLFPLQKLMNTEHSTSFEMYFSDRQRWYIITAYGHGSEHISLLFQDITEQKQTEKRLGLQGLVMDQIKDHVTITDLNGVIQYVNQAEASMVGLDPQDMIGASTEIYGEDPEQGATQQEMVENAKHLGYWRGEVINYTADGQPFILDCRIQLVHDEKGQPVALCGISTDITERKQMEESLREREENLRITLQSIGDGVIVTDTDGRVTGMNPIAEKLTGWTLGEAREKPLKEVFPIVNSHTQKAVENPVDKVFQTGETVGLANHTLLMARDGSRYQIADSASPIHDRHGTIQGVVLVFRDITEEYLLQERLKESEERLKLAMAVANDGILDWNLKENTIFFDQRFFTMAGYEPDAFPHTLEEWRQRIHTEDLQQTQKALSEHLDGTTENFRHEFRFLSKSGDWIWILGKGEVVEWDGERSPLRMVVTHTDITDRKRAELQLQESEQRFDLAIKGTGAGIWDWDLQENTMLFSRQWKAMLGYRDHELPDTFEAWKERMHPQDTEFVEKAMEEYLKGQRDTFDIMYRLRHKKGPYRWIMSRGHIIRDAQGIPHRWIGINLDVTRQKEAEESIKKRDERGKKQREAIARLFLDKDVHSGNREKAFKTITQVLSHTLDVQRVSIWLVQEDGLQLHCLTLYERETNSHSQGLILETQSVPYYFESILKEGRISVEDAQNDPRTRELNEQYLKSLGITAMIDGGIVVEGKLKGVICLEHVGDKRSWHPDEEVFVSTVAAMIAQVFLNEEWNRSQQSLMESEERNRALLQAVPDLMFLFDQDTMIVDYKAADQGDLYVAPERFINKKAEDVLPPEVAYLTKTNIQTVFATGEAQHYEYTLTINEEEKSYETRLVLCGEDKALAIVRDITERKETEGKIKETKEKVEQLHESTLKMSLANDEERVYQLIIEAAEKILQFTLCTVDMVEDEYFVVKATSREMPEGGSQNMPISEGIAGKTFKEGRAIIINDLWSATDGNPRKKSFRSLLSIPMGDVGLFQAVATKKDAFSLDDVKLTDILASHGAEAIKRIRSEKDIRYMSFHDSLTKLYNRAFLEQEIQRLNTARQLPLSIIMGDINGLKMVNDAYGHVHGDTLLKGAADLLRKLCREEDLIARWGGDEFVILLPQTPYLEAHKICERILEASQGLVFSSIPLSMALGVATKEEENEDIFEILGRAEERMYRNKLSESRSARSAVLTSLVKTLEEKSQETEEHTFRMGTMAQKIGQRIGLLQEELNRLGLLVSLHDIGKITVSQEILNKPGRLTEEEWELIQSHPETGYRIARSTEDISHVAEDILAHHERWDGKGYPQGLKGEDIPLLARITAIVDAYDVMIRGRPYKRPMSREETIEELQRCAGTQFDAELVQVFVSILNEGEKSM